MSEVVDAGLSSGSGTDFDAEAELNRIIAEAKKEEEDFERIETVLSFIKWDGSLGKVKFEDRSLLLNKRSQYQLMGILGIPRGFSRKLFDKDPEVWEIAKSRCYDPEHAVTLVVEDEKILYIQDHKKPCLSNVEFCEIIEQMLDAGIYDLRSITKAGPRMQACFGLSSTGGEMAFQTHLGRDVFKTGLELYSSEDQYHNPSISQYLDRLICSNMCRVTEKSFKAQIKKPKDNLNEAFWEMVADFGDRQDKFRGAVERNVQRLGKAQLSVQEVMDYHRNFMSYVDNAMSAGELTEDIVRDEVYPKFQPIFPITNLNESYNSHFADPTRGFSGQSRAWRSSAPTGINAFDFFNNFTWLTTHDENLSDRIKLELQIIGGNMLFKKNWDLAQVDKAPWLEQKDLPSYKVLSP